MALPDLGRLALHPTGAPGDKTNARDWGQPFAGAPSASFGPGRARVRDTHTALEHAQRNAREQQEDAQLQQAQENEQDERDQDERQQREKEFWRKQRELSFWLWLTTGIGGRVDP